MEPDFSAASLESPTGATLCVRTLAPAGTPRAVVHINHGMAEHSARYERFARFLAGRGYAAVAHDHRGHGITTAPGAQLGMFGDHDGWSKALDDMSAVADSARKRFPGAPVVTFGHSMGAMMALDHCTSKPGETDAAAFWNASFDTPAALSLLVAMLNAERFFKGSDTPSRLATKATFEDWNRRFKPNRTAFDWLSSDTREVDLYVGDPLCGFPMSVGAWLEVIASIRRSSAPASIARLPKTLPVHLCAGSEDPSTSGGAAVVRLGKTLRKAGLRDVTVKVVDGARHEGLNETGRDAIMSGFADWLDRRFPKRAS